MLVGYHCPQLVFQFLLCEALFISAHIILWNHDVNTIAPVADVRVDPIELFTQLLNIHSAGAQHTQPTGLAHRHHHVAAMCKGEDGRLYNDVVTERGAPRGVPQGCPL